MLQGRSPEALHRSRSDVHVPGRGPGRGTDFTSATGENCAATMWAILLKERDTPVVALSAPTLRWKRISRFWTTTGAANPWPTVFRQATVGPFAGQVSASAGPR